MSSVVTRTRRFSLRSVTHKYKYARAFTFLFLVMKRNAETSKPRRSAKAPTGASSRAPPFRRTRRSGVARRSPPDSTRRGARVVRARVPRRSRRYPRCLDASQPERLGDQGERLLERRTTRARFKKNAASLLRGPRRRRARGVFSSRAPRRGEATRASVSACGARSGAKTHGASLPVSEDARARAPRQREKERGGAPREFRGPFLGGRRGPRPRRAVRSGGTARTPKTRRDSRRRLFLSSRLSPSPRVPPPYRDRPAESSRGTTPRSPRGREPPRSRTRDVSRLGGEARLRAV